jgi:hypothetical protein
MTSAGPPGSGSHTDSVREQRFPQHSQASPHLGLAVHSHWPPNFEPFSLVVLREQRTLLGATCAADHLRGRRSGTVRSRRRASAGVGSVVASLASQIAEDEAPEPRVVGRRLEPELSFCAAQTRFD